MDRRDDHQQKLEQLFAAAKRIEQEDAPDWREVTRRPAPRRVSWYPEIRTAVVTAGAGLAIAATAFWMTDSHFNSRLPNSVVIAQSPAASRPPSVRSPLTTSSISTPGKGSPAVTAGNAAGNELVPDSPPTPVPSEVPPGTPTRELQAAREDARRQLESRTEAKTLEALVYAAAPPAEQSTVEEPVTGMTRTYENVLTLAPGSSVTENGAPPIHGSRSRELEAAIAGMKSADSLTGQLNGLVAGDATEQMKVVSSGAAVEFARAQGGFTRVIQVDDAEERVVVESGEFNTEAYDGTEERQFVSPLDVPLSTFSVDVDTASYANVRRFLSHDRLPPRDAVRIEELINYFPYDYPAPSGDAPFSINVEIAGCPWNESHRLARIGLKGKDLDRGEFAGSNLVFLVDVSGSMRDTNKLPLLKSALAMLAEQLDGRDQVAIVTYAGSSGIALPPTPGSATHEIIDVISGLHAGGGTNGAEGLRTAYRLAREGFVPGGVNRVILATDGDFNVGVSSQGGMVRLIREQAGNGIFLTALGVGMGNYKDAMLETIADKGNGNYHYLDNLREARKVLVEQISGTLVTIAKDVKIQVEFNPAEVGAYRLIGYENRMLQSQDFNDDRKDAGEIGAGHTVTALYEIVPPGKAGALPGVDALKYQKPANRTEHSDSGESLTVKIRYKEPEGTVSRLLSRAVFDRGLDLRGASDDFRFASAVAEFGLVLRESDYRGDADLHRARERAGSGGPDKGGSRAEFLELIQRAARISVERAID